MIAAAVTAICRQVKSSLRCLKVILWPVMKRHRAVWLCSAMRKRCTAPGNITLDEYRRIEKQRIFAHGLPVLRRRDERVLRIAFWRDFSGEARGLSCGWNRTG